MLDPNTLSVEDWKSLFRSLPREELQHLQAIIDRVEAKSPLTPDDRRTIVAMFGRPADETAAA